jgi:hypothetical protein
VPARGIGKEIAACFDKPPLAEVMQLMGLALPHRDEREPAAALATAAAGAGGRKGIWRTHKTVFMI